MQLVLDARMVFHSGIGRYIRYLVPLLLERKDVRLTLLGEKNKLGKVFPGVPVIEMRCAIYSPFEQLEYVKKVPHCDVLWTPHYNAPLLRTKARLTVVTIHDLFPFSPYAAKAGMGFLKRAYARFLLRNAVTRSDRVIAVSEATKKEMIRWTGRSADRISVIHHFIDPVFRKNGGKLPGAVSRLGGKYFLYVGNVKPHKNIRGILGAFRLAEKEMKGVKLVIAGKKDGFITGMKDRGLTQGEPGIRDKVVFTGTLTDRELVALYGHARALLFPSFYEGFGYPPLEAMACGCPSVVSDIPPLRETCGSAAVFVDPASERDIARGMKKADDAANRKKLAVSARRNLERFSRQSILRKYGAFLDDLKRTET